MTSSWSSPEPDDRRTQRSHQSLGRLGTRRACGGSEGAHRRCKFAVGCQAALSKACETVYQFLTEYRELAEAASLTTGERPEWPTRVLSATRWYHEARRAWWPDMRIAAAFAGLEACLLPPKARDKGRQIAEEVGKRVTLPGLTELEQQDWLTCLYRQGRGGSVHEGNPYELDLDDRATRGAHAGHHSLGCVAPPSRPCGGHRIVPHICSGA